MKKDYKELRNELTEIVWNCIRKDERVRIQEDGTIIPMDDWKGNKSVFFVDNYWDKYLENYGLKDEKGNWKEDVTDRQIEAFKENLIKDELYQNLRPGNDTRKVFITKNELKEMLWETLNSKGIWDTRLDYCFVIYNDGRIFWSEDEANNDLPSWYKGTPIYLSDASVLKADAWNQELLDKADAYQRLRKNVTEEEKQHFFDTALEEAIYKHSEYIDWEKQEVIMYEDGRYTYPGTLSTARSEELAGITIYTKAYDAFCRVMDFLHLPKPEEEGYEFLTMKKLGFEDVPEEIEAEWAEYFNKRWKEEENERNTKTEE